MKFDFTKRKFLNLPIEKQHKECAEMLRAAYEEHQHKRSTTKYFDAYHEMVKWLEAPPLLQTDTKSIADRYHEHLREALIKHKEHNLLPAIRRGDKRDAESPWSIAVYLDQLRSAHNVGSILRTIEAFSMGKVYFSKDTPFITHKQVQDAAMGASQWIECYQDIPLKQLPRPIIAIETAACATALNDFIFPETCTIAMGNEEYGCSDATLEMADFIVEIPLRGHKNSLNVANAFAIISAEIHRQKHSNTIKE